MLYPRRFQMAERIGARPGNCGTIDGLGSGCIGENCRIDGQHHQAVPAAHLEQSRVGVGGGDCVKNRPHLSGRGGPYPSADPHQRPHRTVRPPRTVIVVMTRRGMIQKLKDRGGGGRSGSKCRPVADGEREVATGQQVMNQGVHRSGAVGHHVCSGGPRAHGAHPLGSCRSSVACDHLCPHVCPHVCPTFASGFALTFAFNSREGHLQSVCAKPSK